jgi:hypothetical protein
MTDNFIFSLELRVCLIVTNKCIEYESKIHVLEVVVVISTLRSFILHNGDFS